MGSPADKRYKLNTGAEIPALGLGENTPQQQLRYILPIDWYLSINY